MEITKEYIDKFISDYQGILTHQKIFEQLTLNYEIKNDSERYVVNKLIESGIDIKIQTEETIQKRRMKLDNLKKLVLPEQRTPEWYEMRKEKLTASSLASAIGHCHFKSREELIYDKIIEAPFEPNPITEWGVKYEDVAIMFYEELYNVSVLEFGLIPHPEFGAFGASPDGICDDTGNNEYLGRMVEIKCPPKRKFTKTVPPHYLMQVQGQLEVCDLDECDFFQVKLEEYASYEEYCNDTFEIDGSVQKGRTSLNYPKSVAATYKVGEKLSYEFLPLNHTNEEVKDWADEHASKDNFFEIKYWRIDRYECTLVTRDKDWWIGKVDKILHFYNDLIHYKTHPEKLEELKKSLDEKKKRKKKTVLAPLDDFQLISDEEDN
jgi:putative phage-type endonuclease